MNNDATDARLREAFRQMAPVVDATSFFESLEAKLTSTGEGRGSSTASVVEQAGALRQVPAPGRRSGLRVVVFASVAVVLVAALAIGGLQAVKHLGNGQPIVVITDDTVPATNASSRTAASSTWTHLTPATDWLIPARAFQAMVYDPADGKVILFGGQADAGYLGDTSAYDPVANTWTELHPTGDLPPARIYHAMAYASATGKVILFGGMMGSTFNDTWAYDPVANTWTELHPSGSVPPARMAHDMVYASAIGKVILFGGTDATSFNDTWAYDPAANAWTELHPTGPVPPARLYHSMVYDSATGKVILFGGVSGRFFTDTWAYDPVANTWTDLKPSGEVPSGRNGPHSMAYDSATGKVILFGGVTEDDDSLTFLNDTWAYDPVANTWTELRPTGDLPPGRSGHSVVFASSSGRVILFGGYGETGYLDDTWSFGSSTAPTGTTLSSPVDAERVFMKELAPDFISWVSVIRDRQANNATDVAVHRELQRLQQQWTGRQAPSTRTQAFLDGWLTDLGTCEKYWALIVKNDAAGAEAMSKEVDQAILGAHLPETLSAILADLRILTDDVGEIMSTTTTVAPTTTTLPPVTTSS